MRLAHMSSKTVRFYQWILSGLFKHTVHVAAGLREESVSIDHVHGRLNQYY